MTTAVASDENTGESAQHDAEHTRPRYDDINTTVVLLVGIVSAIVTLLTIWFVQGIAYQWQNSYIRDRSLGVANTPVQEIINDQKAMLVGSSEEGTISIDDAMQKVVAEYGHSEQAPTTEETDH